MNSPAAIHAMLDALCLEAGAIAWGVAEAGPVADADNRLYDAWLARGAHGPLAYMERNGAVRRDPRLLLDGARSIVVLAFAIRQRRHSSHIADFALGSDYHDVLRARLRPVAEAIEAEFGGATRICVDSAPLRERYWAERAGVGKCGLNGRLIVPGYGSDVLLAEVLAEALLPPTPQSAEIFCVGCRRCVDACPVGALDGCGGVDAGRCLACATIELRGPLPPGTRLHGRLAGCDTCGRVCPLNAQAVAIEPLPELQPREAVLALTPAAAAALDAGEFARIFRGSAVKRLKLEGLHRNALHIINEETIHN
ncbi:MAG: DUF1730 domain-containing protein [Muribaculaceae bacterium]|nr:DUF1730 domain-containing protein [Muribaculaceae bacterium]